MLNVILQAQALKEIIESKKVVSSDDDMQGRIVLGIVAK